MDKPTLDELVANIPSSTDDELRMFSEELLKMTDSLTYADFVILALAIADEARARKITDVFGETHVYTSDSGLIMFDSLEEAVKFFKDMLLSSYVQEVDGNSINFRGLPSDSITLFKEALKGGDDDDE